MNKKSFLILIVCFLVLTFGGDILLRQIALHDVKGVSVGMTVEEVRKTIPEGELFLAGNYGFFVNNMGYPIGLRCEDKTVAEIKIFDTAKMDRSIKGFEALKPGMTIFQVCQLVSVPAAIASEEGPAFYFLCSDDLTYTVTFEEADGEWSFVKAEPVKADEG